MNPQPLLTPPKGGEPEWAKPTADEVRGILKAFEELKGLRTWSRLAGLVNHMRGLGLAADLTEGKLEAIKSEVFSPDSVISADIATRVAADLSEAGVKVEPPNRAVTFMKRHIGFARAGRNVSLAEAVHYIKATGADIEILPSDWETLNWIRGGKAKSGSAVESRLDLLWHMRKSGMDFEPTAADRREAMRILEAYRSDRGTVMREFHFENIAETFDKIKAVWGHRETEHRPPLPPLKRFGP